MHEDNCRGDTEEEDPSKEKKQTTSIQIIYMMKKRTKNTMRNTRMRTIKPADLSWKKKLTFVIIFLRNKQLWRNFFFSQSTEVHLMVVVHAMNKLIKEEDDSERIKGIGEVYVRRCLLISLFL